MKISRSSSTTAKKPTATQSPLVLVRLILCWGSAAAAGGAACCGAVGDSGGWLSGASSGIGCGASAPGKGAAAGVGPCCGSVVIWHPLITGVRSRPFPALLLGGYASRDCRTARSIVAVPGGFVCSFGGDSTRNCRQIGGRARGRRVGWGGGRLGTASGLG